MDDITKKNLEKDTKSEKEEDVLKQAVKELGFLEEYADVASYATALLKTEKHLIQYDSEKVLWMNLVTLNKYHYEVDQLKTFHLIVTEEKKSETFLKEYTELLKIVPEFINIKMNKKTGKYSTTPLYNFYYFNSMSLTEIYCLENKDLTIKIVLSNKDRSNVFLFNTKYQIQDLFFKQGVWMAQ